MVTSDGDDIGTSGGPGVTEDSNDSGQSTGGNSGGSSGGPDGLSDGTDSSSGGCGSSGGMGGLSWCITFLWHVHVSCSWTSGERYNAFVGTRWFFCWEKCLVYLHRWFFW